VLNLRQVAGFLQAHSFLGGLLVRHVIAIEHRSEQLYICLFEGYLLGEAVVVGVVRANVWVNAR
jgi:hypothetical protein